MYVFIHVFINIYLSCVAVVKPCEWSEVALEMRRVGEGSREGAFNCEVIQMDIKQVPMTQSPNVKCGVIKWLRLI